MNVMAFVDGSIYSASVCDHAAWLAARHGASVHVFHMLAKRDGASMPADLSGNLKLGARSDLLEKLSKADEDWAHLAQARGRVILEDAQARITQSTDLSVETRLRHDDLVDAIVDFEKDADLIVIGKRGEASASAREHLGSNLERALRSATKPVLVANRDFEPIENCLVAYDCGPSVKKAIRFLVKHAEAYKDIAFHLLMIGKPTANAQTELEGVAASMQVAGLTVTHESRGGEPDRAIPGVALKMNSQMLVMGAYGHSHIRNLIIGSTTTALVRSCRLPILLVR